MERHILQSVVADEGHPAGQQLWHLKLLVLKLAEGNLAGEQGEQPPRACWGVRSCCPIPVMPQKHPGVRPVPRALPPHRLLTVPAACINTRALPFPAGLFVRGSPGGLRRKERDGGPGPGGGEH